MNIHRALIAFAFVFPVAGKALALNPIFYGGNGTTQIDSGLPNVGVMYGVNENGDLLWYRYQGAGQQDPAGRVPPWHPNTGHVIGNGWRNFSHIMGCGDGVILAVKPTGELVWYRYSGDGTNNPEGNIGWDSNSRNVIGGGWNTFTSVFCTPREGRARAITVYGVTRTGDLRWYRYTGNGEPDPTGKKGWAPNQGNIIGNGWQNFRQIFTSGGAIFAIEKNGDLRWYAYYGNGEPDSTGTKGWAPHSSNVIGSGWQNFRTVFGGSNDSGGFAAIIYPVTTDGKLLWYRYSGDGTNNPEGNIGWAPNSKNQIGHGW